MLVPADIILNNIHMVSGYKADIYPLRPGDELRASAFKRRQMVDLGEPLGQIYLYSPEDLIVYKIWYYGLSQQTKHLRDITSIVTTLGDELDYDYIEFCTQKKGLTTLWHELLGRIRA